jgi:hypothetical protein
MPNASTGTSDLLGNLEDEFHWRPGAYWIIFFVGLFAFLLGSLLALSKIERPGADPNAPLILIAIGMSLMLAFGAANRFKPKVNLRIHEEGFHFESPRLTATHLWRDITNVKLPSGADFFPKIAVNFSNSPSLKLPIDYFSSPDKTQVCLNFAMQGAKRNVVSHIEAIERGKTVYVGPFSLGPTGISYKDCQVPWKEFGEFRSTWTSLLMRYGGSKKKEIQLGNSDGVFYGVDEFDKTLAIVDEFKKRNK